MLYIHGLWMILVAQTVIRKTTRSIEYSLSNHEAELLKHNKQIRLEIQRCYSTITITPNVNGSVVVEAGTNWTATCHSDDEPILWTYTNMKKLDKVSISYHNGSAPELYNAAIFIPNLKYEDGKMYSCNYKEGSGTKKDDNSGILVHLSVEKKLLATPSINASLAQDINEGDNFTLICSVEAPCEHYHYKLMWANKSVYDESRASEASWFDSKDRRQVLCNCSRNLTVVNASKKDSGKYVCTLTSFDSITQDSYVLNVKDLSNVAPSDIRDNYWWLFAGLAPIVGVIAALTLLIIRLRRKKTQATEEADPPTVPVATVPMENESYEITEFNPDLNVNEQAELLPYCKKRWEISRNKLQLGMKLGEGAFGLVRKGTAEGLSSEDGGTTVAVKMVKSNAYEIAKSRAYEMALEKELKILSNLKPHINIVNLLGACSNNGKDGLYIIVEFCRFGSLKSYMKKHGNEFKNQLNPFTNKIEVNYEPPKIIGPPLPGYTTLEDAGLVSPTQCFENSSSRDEETLETSSDLNETCKYRGDYVQISVSPITTSDLVYWAYQVARGMEHLATRKVVHGDLAARNIVLTDNKIVKICDFGLAHELYDDSYLTVPAKGNIPIWWMAIEAIRERRASSRSDVWSYGILLWEIFTLGNVPYAEMSDVGRLLEFLDSGERLCKPVLTPSEVYQLMIDCWNRDPYQRPSFQQISTRLGEILDECDESILQNYFQDMQNHNSKIGVSDEEADEDFLRDMYTSTSPGTKM